MRAWVSSAGTWICLFDSVQWATISGPESASGCRSRCPRYLKPKEIVLNTSLTGIACMKRIQRSKERSRKKINLIYSLTWILEKNGRASERWFNSRGSARERKKKRYACLRGIHSAVVIARKGFTMTPENESVDISFFTAVSHTSSGCWSCACVFVESARVNNDRNTGVFDTFDEWFLQRNRFALLRQLF